jgi:uncharacterized membrane protein YgcG
VGDLLREGALCAWFALVAVAFWGANLLGSAALAAALTGVYGLFLLAFVAAVALRLLRRRTVLPDEAAPAPRNPFVASSVASPRAAAPRGGAPRNTKNNATFPRSGGGRGNHGKSSGGGA